MLQLFKVSEIAEKLGKSKTAIYKKSNKFKVELEPHRKKLNGVVYYDSDGFDIIKNSFSEPIIETKGLNYQDDKYMNLLLSEKDEQIKHLKEQLKEKENSLNTALELVKNNQVLLLHSQERVAMLESPIENKSFWSKFKKNKSF